MERKINFYKIAVGLLIAMHIAGIVGLQHPFTRPLFQQLIAFNLLVTAALVFYFHTDYNPAFLVFCVITFLFGYFIEVIGVKQSITW